MNGVTYDGNLKNVYASSPSGITAFAPNGGTPNGGVSATFAMANAVGVAFAASGPYGALNELVIAQGGGSPAVTFTDESGNGRGSHALPAVPLAVAFGAPLTATTQPVQSAAQVYVTQPNAISALSFTGEPVSTIADGGTPFGIVVDPNLSEPFVAGTHRKSRRRVCRRPQRGRRRPFVHHAVRPQRDAAPGSLQCLLNQRSR